MPKWLWIVLAVIGLLAVIAGAIFLGTRLATRQPESQPVAVEQQVAPSAEQVAPDVAPTKAPSLRERRAAPPPPPADTGQRELPSVKIDGGQPQAQTESSESWTIGWVWGSFWRTIGKALIYAISVIVLVLLVLGGFAHLFMGKKWGEAFQWGWELIQLRLNALRDVAQDKKIAKNAERDAELAERVARIEGRFDAEDLDDSDDEEDLPQDDWSSWRPRQ